MGDIPKTLPLAIVYRLECDESSEVTFDGLFFLHSVYLRVADLPKNPELVDYLAAASRDLEMPYGVWNKRGKYLTVDRFAPTGQVIVDVCEIEPSAELAEFFCRLDDLIAGLGEDTQEESELRFNVLQQTQAKMDNSLNPFHGIIALVASAAVKLQLPARIQRL